MSVAVHRCQKERKGGLPLLVLSPLKREEGGVPLLVLLPLKREREGRLPLLVLLLSKKEVAPQMLLFARNER